MSRVDADLSVRAATAADAGAVARVHRESWRTSYTGILPLEVIERDTDRDNFMGAEDAVKYGLVDRVLKNRSESAVA